MTPPVSLQGEPGNPGRPGPVGEQVSQHRSLSIMAPFIEQLLCAKPCGTCTLHSFPSQLHRQVHSSPSFIEVGTDSQGGEVTE